MACEKLSVVFEITINVPRSRMLQRLWANYLTAMFSDVGKEEGGGTAWCGQGVRVVTFCQMYADVLYGWPLIARHIAKRGFSRCWNLFVCLSVTVWYCVKTEQIIVKLPMPHCSPILLVYADTKKTYPKIQRDHPQPVASNKVGLGCVRVSVFRPKSPLFRKRWKLQL